MDPSRLHELLTYCVDFATTMLNDSGDFYPFGAVIGSDGELRTVAGYDGAEQPAPRDIYKILGEGFKAMAKAGEIRAAALASNVNIPPEYPAPARDGLRVHIECEGYARFIYVPYVLVHKGLIWKSREASFYEPIPMEVQPAFFGPKPAV